MISLIISYYPPSRTDKRRAKKESPAAGLQDFFSQSLFLEFRADGAQARNRAAQRELSAVDIDVLALRRALMEGSDAGLGAGP